MAFLRRLFGEPATPAPALAPWVLHPSRQEAVVEVVGEAAYQPALERIGGGRTYTGVQKPEQTALLVAEPTNRYDRNAIAVMIEGLRVGYVSREDALAYQPVVQAAARAGRTIEASAYLVGGWDRGGDDRGYIGVRLHLGTPAECLLGMVTSETPVRKDHGCDGWLIAFTGESACALSGVPLDRHAMVQAATEAGMSVHPRVTKKVQLLVVCEGSELSANAQKAREYGIPTVSESALWESLGLPVEPMGWRPPAPVPAR